MPKNKAVKKKLYEIRNRVRLMTEGVKPVNPALNTMIDREGKYLTFCLANEEYGIGILKIKEIIGMMPITPVPRARAYMKGVINLRGKVIPVVDLRLKFGLEEIGYTERTCIVVVETRGEVGSVLVGIVVDSVSEVLNIKGEDIEETSTFWARLDMDYILGMAKMNRGVKILLDIDRVISGKDITLLENTA